MKRRNDFLRGVLCILAMLILAGSLNAEICLDAIAVSGGEDHTLVLAEDGTLWSCGQNSSGQLGVSEDYEPSTSSVLMQVLEGEMDTATNYIEDISDISAGWMHSIALDDFGYVWAWGNNSAGQLGNNSNSLSRTPVQVSAGQQDPNSSIYLSNIVDVAAGRSGTHSLAADADGYCYGWGNDSHGQVGNGNPSPQNLSIPNRVRSVGGTGYLQGIIAVSAGEFHSMVLSSDGNVYTFGDDHEGQLGNGGVSGDQTSPVKVLSGEQSNSNTYLENIIAVSAGWEHCMALDSDGFVYTWGSNHKAWSGADGGRLGNGKVGTEPYDSTSSEDKHQPVYVLRGQQSIDPNRLTNIIAISAGESHGMALDNNGNVWTWGDNNFSQLGDGTNTDRLTPVKVVTGDQDSVTGYLEDIVAISAGYWHCLAIDKYGTLYSWGRGSLGRLGLGTTNSYNEPKHVNCPADEGFILKKYDDIDDESCGVDPSDPDNDEITYTIYCANPPVGDPNYIGTINDVVITDFLPDGIDPFSVTVTGGGDYDMFENIVTWTIGTLDPGDSESVTVTIEIVDAEPISQITNTAILTSDVGWVKATETTPVCCWGGDIIYVDQSGSDTGNGTSWSLAYNDLQDALERAAQGCGDEIWVAGGIYSPGDDTADTFTIPDGVAVYGGLTGTEDPEDPYDDPNSRTFIKCKSILTGNDYHTEVVTMGQSTKLHGFVVEKGLEANIYGDGDKYTVEYCIVSFNTEDGIYCKSGNLIANWCIIRNNDENGIYHEGNARTLTINNCKIYGNKQNGVYARQSTPTILNSEIHHNGRSGGVYYGIRLYKPSGVSCIRNNTIVYNENEGIFLEYDGHFPNVENCILWHNNFENDFKQIDGFWDTYDSCITDPNNPFGGSSVPDEDGNITCNPDFANSDPNIYNYHLSTDSDCIDAGNTGAVGAGELDIDAEDRIYDTYVDMGSDELDGSLCTDDSKIANDLDLNGDGLVNNREFAIFADAWLAQDPAECSDPNFTANWNPKCNFDDTDDSQYIIDLADLIFFAENWAWQACWKYLDQGFAMMMSAGEGGGESMLMALPVQKDSILIAKTSTAILKPLPTLKDKIEQAEDGLDFLNDVKEDEDVKESINQDNLQRVIDSLEDQIEEWMNQLL